MFRIRVVLIAVLLPTVALVGADIASTSPEADAVAVTDIDPAPVPPVPPPDAAPLVGCPDSTQCWFTTPDGVVHDGYRYQTSAEPGAYGSVGWWEHVSHLPAGTYFKAQLCNGTIPYVDSGCGPWSPIHRVPQPATEAKSGGGGSIPEIIRHEFAQVGAPPATQDKAVAVAWCESRHVPTATNGQYLGLFQMGRYHYHRFDGPWSDPAVNADAAAELWAESGWQPWACA